MSPDGSVTRETVIGEQRCEVGRGITLCHDTFGDRGHPPLLLVMGLAMQMIAWHDDFCAELASRGFFVVRFDNRDVGLSTHLEGVPAPTVMQILRRRFDPRQYRLADMADDAVGLLRALDLGPAHVVGVSMGGMIAQTMAARSPEAVRSMVSIMSTTGNRRQGQPSLAVYQFLLRRTPHDREAFLARTVRLFRLIGSPGYPFDADFVRERAARSFDRSFDPDGVARQLGAILASGDRTEELGRITAPSLVIHGSSDRMVAPSGGRATARAIPGSRYMVIPGMGHDLPPALWPRIIDAVADHAVRTDALRAAS